MVHKFGYFTWYLRVYFGRKDTVLIIRILDTLWYTLPIISIYLSKVRKYSSSNGCLSLWHNIIFPRLIWCPKSVSILLLDIWDTFGSKDTVLIIRISNMLLDALPIISMYLMKVRKYSRSNGWHSLWHSIIFTRLIWCTKLVILLDFESLFLVEKTLFWP